MRAFALRDLVLVMREDEIDAAAMNVEGLAQMRLAHRGAFDVPAGPPAAPRAESQPGCSASDGFHSTKSIGSFL